MNAGHSGAERRRFSADIPGCHCILARSVISTGVRSQSVNYIHLEVTSGEYSSPEAVEVQAQTCRSTETHGCEG